MLIALVILSVSILGLTATILTSIQVNLENDLRNAAVRVSSQLAEEYRMKPLNDLEDENGEKQLKIRGRDFAFGYECDVTSLSADTRQLEVSVTYSYKGRDRSNKVVFYRHRGT